MTDKFEEAIRKECCVVENPNGSYAVGFTKNAAKAVYTLHQQALKKANEKLVSEFWEESSRLMDIHRANGDEKKVQGIVDCRILINKLSKS